MFRFIFHLERWNLSRNLYVKFSKTDLEKVQESWENLQFGEEQTEDVCLVAVEQDGRALQFIKDQTEKICLAAVLQYVKKQTPEICLTAIDKDKSAEGLVDIKL